MTTYYLDTEGGNDANDGLSFANRKKTIAAFTAALLAPGDVVRMMASRAPSSLGNGTWTDNSQDVVLAAAATMTIDNCDSGWTAGSGVTITNSTTRIQGTASLQLAVNGTTVTGAQLLAYKALGATTDFSAYKGVSMRMYFGSTAYNPGSLALNFCSDSAGAVPLLSIPLADLGTATVATTWLTIEQDTGAALPSGVNSIAIVSISDPLTVTSTVNVHFDNIIAVKGRDDAGHLSHQTLIGKNNAGEPEWYPIRYIDGTTVKLGNHAATLSATGRNYRGTTETVTTYSLTPNRSRMNSTQRMVQDSGTGYTDATRITYSGGWDRTNMSAQSGESWFTGEGHYSGFADYNIKNYISFTKVGISHFGGSVYGIDMSYGTGAKLDLIGAASIIAGRVVDTSPSASGILDVSLGNVVMCQNTALDSLNYSVNTKVRGRRITGSDNWGMNVTYGAGYAGDLASMDMVIDQIDNCPSGAYLGDLSIGVIKGCTFKWNDSDGTVQGASAHLQNCKFPLNAPNFTFAAIVPGQSLRMTAVNGDAWDNRYYSRWLSIITDAATFRTSGYRSIKISPTHTAYYSDVFPARHPLLKVACKANVPVSVESYLRRDNTGLTVGLMVMAGAVDGVVDHRVSMTAAANTWEKVTISFTPTKDGIVEVFGYCNGGTYNAWFTEAKVV